MTSSENIDHVSLHRALGVTAPPDKITQEAIKHDDKYLRRLARLKPGEKAEPEDLGKYAEDLLCTGIQTSLLVYLLPFCLTAWRHDLKGNYGYGGFVEHFYSVLANRPIFDEYLNEKQAAVVSGYMRQVILEEIDDQRGLTYQGSRAKPYRWIGAMTTYGVLRPDIESLWTKWWSVETIGRAGAAVQYISCLMYSEYENPVFAPWTPDGGGGPPCLWGFEGHVYEHRWLSPNVKFLRQILNTANVSKLADRSAERLVGEPESQTAGQIKADFPLLTETLEARCAELPRLLETVHIPTPPHRWST